MTRRSTALPCMQCVFDDKVKAEITAEMSTPFWDADKSNPGFLLCPVDPGVAGIFNQESSTRNAWFA